MALASITASVFTAAGLATISNQLLADSNPAVDGLVTADLAKRLVALEETAFLAAPAPTSRSASSTRRASAQPR
jgi:HK97 family phage major capsid protein